MIETLCQFAQSITLLLAEKMVAYLGDGMRVIDILQNVILQNVILQNVILQNVNWPPRMCGVSGHSGGTLDSDS